MSEKMKFKLGIYCMSMMTMAVMIVSPTIELTAREFSDVPIKTVMYITALPTLFAIPSALVCGWLAKKLGGRTVAIISMLLFSLSGIGVILSKTLNTVLVFRAINGIAIGLCVASLILQGQLFPPEDRRAISGSTAFVSNVMGILYAVVSGFLSKAFGWRASYYIYLLCLPAIIVILLTLPNKAECERRVALQMANAPKEVELKEKEPFNWGFYYILVLILFTFLSVGILSANSSILVVEKGLGTSATTGIIMMVDTFVAGVIGFFYGKISEKTKRYNFAIGPIFMGIGYFMLARSTSFGMLIASMVVHGIGWGYTLAESRVLIFGNTVPSNRGTGLSLMSTTMNFGQFISPAVSVPLAAVLFGNGAADRFKLAAVITVIAGIIFIFIDPKKANKVEEL